MITSVNLLKKSLIENFIFNVVSDTAKGFQVKNKMDSQPLQLPS